MRCLVPVAPFALVLIFSGCQTSGTPAEGDAADVLASEQKPTAIAAKSEGGRLAVGPLHDEDLRRLVYQGLEKHMSKTQSLGEGGEEKTALGDFDSFKFNVLRLTKGGAELTGSETADAADVEVTGWYKVTIASSDASDADPSCTSFDARMQLVQKGGDWQVEGNEGPVMGRQDAEDCF